MESVKFWSRAQRLSICAKDRPGCGGRVDNDDRDVAEHDLVDVTILLRPLAVPFGSVDANVPDIANQWQPAWPLHVGEAQIVSDDLVDEEVDQEEGEEAGDQVLDRIPLDPLRDGEEEVGDGHA